MEWTSFSKSNTCASEASRDRNAIRKGPCRSPSFLADHFPCGPGNSTQKPVFVLDFWITYDICIARDNHTFPFWKGGRHGGAILRDFFFCGMFLNVYIRTDNLRYRKETLMPDDVDTLEIKRSKLLEEFLSLGDLRPGSLTAVMRRCGKPSCHCAKRNDPGHDPQFRLTRRVAGKTVTETFPNPTALRKAQQE